MPPPAKKLEPWLEDGWDDPTKSAAFKTSRTLPSGAEERFESDLSRVRMRDEWLSLRKFWARRQQLIRRTKDLYGDLREVGNRLERESETLELLVGTGFVRSRSHPTIDYPLVLKRVVLGYDARSDAMLVDDADVPVQLHSSILSEIEGLDLRTVRSREQQLANEDLHPLGAGGLADFLTQLVHELSPRGVYLDERPHGPMGPGVDLIVYDHPVLFLRRRPDGTVKALERIAQSIQDGMALPEYLHRLMSGGTNDETADDPGERTLEQRLAEVGGEDADILLSKEANREQLEIARRVERHGAVIVQGPPGTGKTHTIANLIGHFLSQGQTVLVTSQRRKALGVLKEKVPEELQSLCVSVLEDSNADMERSIDGIVEFRSTHDSHELRRQAAALSDERDALMSELARVRRDLFALRCQEAGSIVVQGESISVVEAARYVGERRDELADVIPGPIAEGCDQLPLSSDELAELYRSNVQIDAQTDAELACALPELDTLLTPQHLAETFAALDETTARLDAFCAERGWRLDRAGTTLETPLGIVGLGPSSKAALDALSVHLDGLAEHGDWQVGAAVDGRRSGGYRERWEVMFGHIERAASLSSELVVPLATHVVKLATGTTFEQVEEGLSQLRDVFAQKGRPSFLDRLFSPGIKLAEESVLVDGHAPHSEQECACALGWGRLAREREAAATLWDQLMASRGAPCFSSLDATDPEQTALRWLPEIRKCLDWNTSQRGQLSPLMEAAGIHAPDFLRSDPLADEEQETRRTLEAARTVVPDIVELCRIRLEAGEQRQALADAHRMLASEERGRSALCLLLARAVDERDADAYQRAYDALASMCSQRGARLRRIALLERLGHAAPGLADAIRDRRGIHAAAMPPEQLAAAWRWKRLSAELERLASEGMDALQGRALELGAAYRSATARLAAARAWASLLERTERNSSLMQALVGWQKTVKQIGKGTGKRAPRLKAQARSSMAQCQRAVPAWIMTVDRALETLDPKSNHFDVAIIDEASQSDLSALGIACLASKTIVVGDDKQVSPMAIGVTDTQVEALLDLHRAKLAIPNVHLYTPRCSLYDIAATTFQPLMLREHFRCVPDIIGFSNQLSYDNKIRPLRDQSSSRLLPAVVSQRVEGMRSAGGKVNQREAEEVVALMRACMEQPEYDGKTFGVISLLGGEQAARIQAIVNREIPLGVARSRKILCGIAADFQGDERDVIFLSMVDSGTQEGTLRKRGYGIEDSDRKRYNVAASRAKDQLWVVHSLDPGNDLKDGDLRKELLDYARDPHALARRLERAQQDAESPFEREVAQALLSAGYDVRQQWPVGSYRIDMVVSFGNHRAAVECDGERFHSGEEKIRQDMERQTILERLGWRFVRIRGSQWYRDRQGTLSRVCLELDRLGVRPIGADAQKADAGSQAGSELLDRVRARARELLAQGETRERTVDVDEETLLFALSETRPTHAEEPSRASAAQTRPTPQASTRPAPPPSVERARRAARRAEQRASEPRPARPMPRRESVHTHAVPQRGWHLAGGYEKYRKAQLAVTRLGSPEEFQRRTNRSTILERMAEVVREEGPVEKGLLIKRIRDSFCIKRMGPNLMLFAERLVQDAIRTNGWRTTEFKGHTFIWPRDTDPASYARYRPNDLEHDDGASRGIEEFCFEEIASALLSVVDREGLGLTVEQAVMETSRRLGFRRTGSTVRETIEEVISTLEKRGALCEPVQGRIRRRE